MFLMIVKAIAETRDAQSSSISDCRAQFLADLSRWQMLFTSDDGSLQEFRNAILAIWEVELDVAQKMGPPDAESLLQFQHLALNLIDLDLFTLGTSEGLTSGGLISSQQRWRSMSRESCPISMVTHQDHTFHEPNIDPGDFGLENNQFDDYYIRKFNPGLPYAHFSPLIVFLLAGAVFGILVAFIVGMNMNFYSINVILTS
jgi:hypothetical protein